MKIKIEEYKTDKVSEASLNQTIQSYLGFLSHADSYKLTQKLKNQIWFWLNSG